MEKTQRIVANMWRGVSSTGIVTSFGIPNVCAAVGCMTRGPCGGGAFCSRGAARVPHAAVATATMATPRRTFFTPGPSGKDLLRYLAPSKESAKAFSPLEAFRPPAPLSASDAQPFGSLNRANNLRRYVNVNAAAPASTRDGPAAAAALPSAVPTPAVELSRLLHRHPTDLGYRASSSSTQQPAAEKTARPSAKSSTAVLHEGSTTVANARATIAAAAAAAQQGEEATGSSDAVDVERRETVMKPKEAAVRGHDPRMSFTGAPSSLTASRQHTSRHHTQLYREHCTIGWSPEAFYRVVADVEHYADFLPWCAGSEVHSSRRVGVPRGDHDFVLSTPTSSDASERGKAGTLAATDEVDAIEMAATLTIGFAFLKENYTSRVLLYPGRKIVATLYDEEEGAAAAARGDTAVLKSRVSAPPSSASSSVRDGDGLMLSFLKKAASTAGAAARRSILTHLRCEWDFCAVEGRPNEVEVHFGVSFEFVNPLHRHLIASNVVALMTRSFERRCESLYGPPSATKVSLPLLS